jgi:hypothetical protein
LPSHKKAEPKRRKFHVAKLKEQPTRQEFQISLQNRFSALPILDNVDQDISSLGVMCKLVCLSYNFSSLLYPFVCKNLVPGVFEIRSEEKL